MLDPSPQNTHQQLPTLSELLAPALGKVRGDRPVTSPPALEGVRCAAGVGQDGVELGQPLTSLGLSFLIRNAEWHPCRSWEH